MGYFKLANSSIWIALTVFILALTLACTAEEQPTNEQTNKEPTQQEVEQQPAEAEQNQEAVENSATVTLNALNDSGITGTVSLAPVDSKTKVTINLEGAPEGGIHPVHIHEGTCENLGSPKYPLNKIENGTSETTVDAALGDITGGEFAINVHKSPEEIQAYVACGNV